MKVISSFSSAEKEAKRHRDTCDCVPDPATLFGNCEVLLCAPLDVFWEISLNTKVQPYPVGRGLAPAASLNNPFKASPSGRGGGANRRRGLL